LSLPFLKEVREVQREHPRAGRFRVRGLVAKRTGREPPSERTVGRAMALNRQVHGAPPAWTTDRPDPSAPDGVVKEIPYEPTHCHRYWCIDYRYRVRLGDDHHWTDALGVIEGYSRKILAGVTVDRRRRPPICGVCYHAWSPLLTSGSCARRRDDRAAKAGLQMSAQDLGTPPTRKIGFGAVLRRYRAAAGVTQQELAERTGLSVDAISLLERGGRHRPHRDTVHRLADALGLETQERAHLRAAGHPGAPECGASTPHAQPGSPALPVPPTSLIGRADTVAGVAHLLRRADVRLVTLTGAGGIGKTRVALAVVAEVRDAVADGIVFVPLAAVGGPALLVSAIGQALGLDEATKRPVAESLAATIGDRELLLVLDNFEHLLDTAPLVADLVARCRRLKVLVTSRASLNVRSEHQFPVLPLALPEPTPVAPVEALARNPSVDLFVQRALAAKPGFGITAANAGDVTAICRRLDGLPLAIELAAAWIKILPLRELAVHLSGAFGAAPVLQVLVNGPRDLPERQRTLRHTLDWSHDLLDEGERTLFRRLSVFVGGATLDAIDAIAGDAGRGMTEGGVVSSSFAAVMALVDKNLLRAEEGAGRARFAMLETVRAYAQEHLMASGEQEALRRAHAACYADLAGVARPELTGSGQAVWLACLEDDLPNLRAALEWARQEGDLELGLRLAGELWPFWNRRGYLTEGRAWLEGFLGQVGASAGTVSAAVHARALNGAGVLASRQGAGACAAAFFAQSLPLFRALDQRQAIAVVLNNLGWAAFRGGDYARTTALCEESAALARGLGEGWDLAAALNSLGGVAFMQGAYGRAAARYEECAALYRAGGDEWALAQCLSNLAMAVQGQGHTARAVSAAEEGLALQRRLGDTMGTALSLTNLSGMARERGDNGPARALAEEGLALRRRLNDRGGMAESLRALAAVALDGGDAAQATALYRESLGLSGAVGDRDGSAACLEGLGAAAGAQGRPRRTVRLLGAATALREATGTARLPADQAACDRVARAARAALGDAACAVLWAAGRALSPDEAADAPDEETPRQVTGR